MPTSTARVEANRRNALKSTGPRTPEGKAAARLNAYRHGMAGGGDVIGPTDDARLVAERAVAFGHELAAEGTVGWVLARRAALLSVRMDRLAEEELVAVAAAAERARADFDADRAAAIEELLAEALVPGADPTAPLAALADCPDGLAALLDAWRDLLARLRSGDPAAATEQAARWLRRGDDPAIPSPAVVELARRATAEVDRLRAVLGTMGPAVRAIEQARAEAGRLARFDPGPEATLRRRYEAAAERGMYRAIRTIADLNRQAGRSGAEAELATLWQNSLNLLTTAPVAADRPTPTASAPTQPAAPMASFRTGPAESLASFRAGVDRAPISGPQLPQGAISTDPAGPVARRPRPDLRKLAVHRR